jgi:hypothetical protein
MTQDIKAMIQVEVAKAVKASAASPEKIEASIASLRLHVGALDQEQSLRTATMAQDLEQLEQSLLGKNGAISALKRVTQDIADKVEHGGVAYKKYSFASPEEFLKWMQRAMPRGTPDYGLFVDIFSLLHSLTSGTVTHSEALKTEHDQSKVHYKNSLQSKVSTSFDTNFPDVFGTSDLSGQRFGRAMDSHAKWYDPDASQGLSVMIDQELDRQYLAVVEMIDAQLGGTDLKYLAMDMLNDSKRFFAETNRFIEESYSTMKGGGGLDEKEAWDVTRACFEQILTDIHASRGVVKYTRVDKPLLHVWGALKAHEVMNRYQKFKFKDDPALTGILIRFILKHQKESAASKLLGRVGKLEVAHNGLKQDFTRFKTNRPPGGASGP